MSIQAIETRYNGYRFRSRLEARWAVFFDAVNIEYQYEAQGYNLGEVNYLPDFYLPQLDMHIEIKGTFPTKHEQDKAILMTRPEGGDPSRPVGLFHGDPSPEHQLCWIFGKCFPFFSFVQCDDCGAWGWIAIHVGIKRYFYRMRCPHKDQVFPPGGQQGLFVAIPPAILAAYDTARSARFEHGETPKVQRGRPRK